jgi:hypothetical protein
VISLILSLAVLLAGFAVAMFCVYAVLFRKMKKRTVG